MAFPESIQDLYNQQLINDQPYVDQCIDAIKTQINLTITNAEPYKILFDLEPIIGTLDLITQIRIKDQVIFYFRNIGIRVYIVYNNQTTPNITSSNNYPFAINFNSQYITNSLLIVVEWMIRNDREFMKAYC